MHTYFIRPVWSNLKAVAPLTTLQIHTHTLKHCDIILLAMTTEAVEQQYDVTVATPAVCM